MTEPNTGADAPRARAGVAALLLGLGFRVQGDLAETPRRVVDAYREMLAGYEDDPATHLAVTFAADHDGIVVLAGVPFVSVCEHHLLPFTGTAGVAYIPNGRVVGLSKLARVVDCFARRLQLQERLTDQVADALVTHLQPAGAACLVEAQHGCMTCRGARKAGAVMRTSALRGVFRTDHAARAEVLGLLRP